MVGALPTAPPSPGMYTNAGALTVRTASGTPDWHPLPTLPPSHVGQSDCPASALAWDDHDGYLLTFNYQAPYSPYTANPGTACTYVAGQWSLLNVSGAVPEARLGESLAYDPADGYIVLFGGITYYDQLGAPGLRLHGDTWTFRGGVWRQLNVSSSPSPRSGASLAFDALDGYLVLFGGTDANGTALADTWTFRGGTWTKLTLAASPTPRSDAGIAYDDQGGLIVLFGGLSGTSQPLGDTWTFAGGSWTHVLASPSPGPRYSPGMAFDREDGYLLLFGGGNATSQYGDTWRFTSGAWTELTPANAPPASPTVEMDYDAADGYVVASLGLGGVGSWWDYGVPFIAIIASTPSPATARMSTAFTVTVSGGTSPYTYAWWFGDGATATVSAPSHAYAAPGAYNASVRVRDALGASTNGTYTVTVRDVLPYAAIVTGNPLPATVGDAVAFEAAVTGGTPPFVYAWTFGDGANGTGLNVSHAFSAVGTYNVTVVVRDVFGTPANGSLSVTVRDAFFGLGWWAAAALAIGAAAFLVAGVLVLRRHAPPPEGPPVDPSPPETKRP